MAHFTPADYIDLLRRPYDRTVLQANLLAVAFLADLPPNLYDRGGFLAITLAALIWSRACGLAFTGFFLSQEQVDIKYMLRPRHFRRLTF